MPIKRAALVSDGSTDRALAANIEEAMLAAANAALAEGIDDPVIIRERMLAVRTKIKQQVTQNG